MYIFHLNTFNISLFFAVPHGPAQAGKILQIGFTLTASRIGYSAIQLLEQGVSVLILLPSHHTWRPLCKSREETMEYACGNGQIDPQTSPHVPIVTLGRPAMMHQPGDGFLDLTRNNYEESAAYCIEHFFPRALGGQDFRFINKASWCLPMSYCFFWGGWLQSLQGWCWQFGLESGVLRENLRNQTCTTVFKPQAAKSAHNMQV